MLRLLIVITLSVSALHAQEAEYRTLQVDASAVHGKLRSFQAVNGGPIPVMPNGPELSSRYKEMHIGIVRTHDLYGPTEIDSHFSSSPLLALISDPAGRAAFLKKANSSIIFPDWDADPKKPESYNFAPTDQLIRSIRAVGADVYYRIGRSLQAEPRPVRDPDKYAEVLKHVVLHYNKGWDNGFQNSVKYWEFWDEPEFKNFWPGTPAELYAFYGKSARAIKSVDAKSKVGAIGKAFAHTPGPFREDFLDYVVANRLPLDFYSWHWYASYSADPWDVMTQGQEIRGLLDAHGMKRVESHLAEWNISPDTGPKTIAIHRSMTNAAFTASTLTYLQDAPIQRAILYRGDAVLNGMFSSTGEPFKKFYVFQAMATMLDTPERLSVTGGDNIGFAVLAAKSRDGRTVRVLISNYEIMPDVAPLHPTIVPGTQIAVRLPRRAVQYRNNKGFSLRVSNLKWGKSGYTIRRSLIDQTHNFTVVGEESGTGNTVHFTESLPAPAVELIEIQKK
jgi:xylan 1,4-beta-xylosidase